MLADFPEPNGWDLKNKDVFSKGTLESHVAKARVLIGNPPFEILAGSSPEKPAPAALLDRAIGKMEPGGFLGMVLPRAFLDSVDYTKQRQALLKDFDILSLTALPDRVFLHSEAETAIVVARKHDGASRRETVVFRQVRDQDCKAFETHQRVSWEDRVPQQYFSKSQGAALLVPALRELWEFLAGNPVLQDLATINKGVEYETTIAGARYDDVISDTPKRGFLPGIHKSTDSFQQYVLFKHQYFNADKSLRRRGAWDLDWRQPKVIVPAARHSRGPWRFAAALDRNGLLASRLHYAIWPKESNLPAEVIAAILNSPIGAAYTYCHSFGHTVPKRTYGTVPFPALSLLDSAVPRLKLLVDQFVTEVRADWQDDSKLRSLLIEIDACVLSLYQLPPHIEHQLLSLFWDQKRRVPFDFQGYYPPSMQSHIPLQIYQSVDYNRSSVSQILERMPKASLGVIELLKSIGREPVEH
jgi:hypothetical protein